MSAAILANLGDRLPAGARVLDFGCGVGKALIGLQEQRPDLDLHGCDLSINLVDWCRANIVAADVRQTDLSPPLPWPSGHFDAINAVSVFTHMTIEHAFRWAWELHRVLKPGGLLHLTTHGVGYFGLFADEASNHSGRTTIIRNLGPGSFMELIQPSEHEGEGQLAVAVATERLAIEAIFSGFEVMDFLPEQSIGNGHDAYVLRKVTTCEVIHQPMKSIELLPSDGMTFAFHIDGQRRFDVFVAAGTPGAHDATPFVQLDATLAGERIVSARRRVGPGERIIGDKQMHRIGLDLHADGLLTVRVKSSVIGGPHLKSMVWFAPHAY